MAYLYLILFIIYLLIFHFFLLLVHAIDIQQDAYFGQNVSIEVHNAPENINEFSDQYFGDDKILIS